MNDFAGHHAYALEQFLATHFPAGWERDGSSDTDVLVRFVRGADRPQVEAVRDAVGELLCAYESEEEVAAYARAIGLGYTPPLTDPSYGEWFAWIGLELTGALTLGERGFVADVRSYDLEQFLGGCFHQDWDMDGPDDVAVLGTFLRDARPKEIVAVREAILELLSRYESEEELVAYADSISLGYHPPGDGSGPTYREWFAWLAAELTAAVDRAR